MPERFGAIMGINHPALNTHIGTFPPPTGFNACPSRIQPRWPNPFFRSRSRAGANAIFNRPLPPTWVVFTIPTSSYVFHLVKQGCIWGSLPPSLTCIGRPLHQSYWNQQVFALPEPFYCSSVRKRESESSLAPRLTPLPWDLPEI